MNPLTKGELKWSSYKKVPVVKLDGEVVVDSSSIMSRLAAEIEASSINKPATSAPQTALTEPAPAAPAKSGW